MNKRKKKFWERVFSVIILIIAILFVIPFVTILSSSFSSETALKLHGFTIFPREFSLEAYETIFKYNSKELFSSYGTTIFTSVVGTFIAMVLTSMLAYPISRSDFRYRGILSFFMYFTMLFGGGTVATYILVSRYLHMSDTIWVLIIPLLISPWHVFLLRTYFASVPKEIIESARIDGLKELPIFVKMVLPLSMNGIATISLFTLLMYWNEWFQSMLYINTDKIVSLQYMLVKMLNQITFMKQSNMFSEKAIPEDNLRMATCILAAGPMIAAFPFFQKYFVKGIMVGSVKG